MFILSKLTKCITIDFVLHYNLFCIALQLILYCIYSLSKLKILNCISYLFQSM